MEEEKLVHVVESLLFVRGASIRYSKLAKLLDVSVEEIRQAVETLCENYHTNGSGLSLVLGADEVQLVSNPLMSEYVDLLVKTDLHGELTKSASEVLAIVAYRGPVSRRAIESIRGVNCQFLIRTLLMRGLIAKSDLKTQNGRDKEDDTESEERVDSRAFYYEVSFPFLRKLGLEKVSDLPNYQILSKSEKVDAIVETAEVE